ncbi:MAG TPA: MBL fold hydrolase, partial [Bdellovibrionales bacterium]|nr:MBL fold hydrolase [Bdellovibrionales bacterium]
MFGNAPRAVWSKWTSPDEQGRIDLACRSFLIQWEGHNILLETGIGSFFEPKMADRFGVQDPDRHLLVEALAEKGLTPSDIDAVVLSHLHFDHAGGLLPNYKDRESGNDELIFPKGQFFVGEEAWKRAVDPHPRDRASFIPGLTEKLEQSGRLTRIPEGGKFPAPYDQILSFRISNGHTPGQLLTQVSGPKYSAIFTGDLVPGSHWIHLPITMGYDRFPEKVIDEKSDLYKEAAPKHWILLFTHDDQVSGAQICQDERGKYAVDQAFPQFEAFQL